MADQRGGPEGALSDRTAEFVETLVDDYFRDKGYAFQDVLELVQSCLAKVRPPPPRPCLSLGSGFICAPHRQPREQSALPRLARASSRRMCSVRGN